MITYYDYDKYFSISERSKLSGLCDTKVKLKFQKNKRKEVLNCKL